MKSFFSLIVIFLISTTLLSQVKMEITLNNGDLKKGVYKIKDNTLGWATKTKIVSRKTKEKYDLKDVRSIVMFLDGERIPYEVIRVKKYLDSPKSKLKLGQVGFKGERIALFYVSEYIYSGGTVGPVTFVDSYAETYLKKKDAGLAYNMGYLYGAGQRGIKKRVRTFFSDCATLVDKVEKNEIPRKDTIQIALFYENQCQE